MRPPQSGPPRSDDDHSRGIRRCRNDRGGKRAALDHNTRFVAATEPLRLAASQDHGVEPADRPVTRPARDRPGRN